MLGLNFLEIQGLSEVHFNISFNDANLVSWLAVHYIDQVVLPAVMNVDGIALHQAGIVGQLVLQDGLRVREIDKGGLVGLQNDEFTFLKVHVS